MEVASPGVFSGVLRGGGLGNCKKRRPPHQEPQRYLARRDVVRGGDLFEDAATSCARAGKVSMTKWTVSDDGNIVRFAPGQHGVFNGALLQMVEHLIAGHMALACNLQSFFKVGHIKIAHAPGEYLPGALKLLEGR